jgi:hypothetical protein
MYLTKKLEVAGEGFTNYLIVEGEPRHERQYHDEHTRSEVRCWSLGRVAGYVVVARRPFRRATVCIARVRLLAPSAGSKQRWTERIA